MSDSEAASRAAFVDILVERAEDAPLSEGIATFLNPYSYLQLRKNAELVRGFDTLYFDGGLMARLASAFGLRVGRQSFDYTGLAQDVFEGAARRGASVALVGGEAGIAEKAADVFVSRAAGLQISYSRSGFFDSAEDRQQAIEALLDLKPEVVIVGMGTPLQEQFLSDLRSAGWRGTGYTCGGFMHQTVGAGGDYYPAWADRLNLRWVYRMMKEPNTRRRYLLIYPRAVVVILSDAVRFRARKRKLSSAGSD